MVWGCLLGLRVSPPRTGKLLLLAMMTVVVAGSVAVMGAPQSVRLGIRLSVVFLGISALSWLTYQLVISLLRRARHSMSPVRGG